jgi:hypothetical protein
MAKLPKSIIKKYGISKKAWAVFRGSSASRGKTTMAKRRYGFARKARRFARRSTNMSSPMGTILPAFVYGAARPALSSLVSPLTSKIPFGNYADELVLGLGGYFMAKKGSGMIRDAGKAILTVEAASLGAQTVGPMLNGMTATVSGNSSNLLG